MVFPVAIASGAIPAIAISFMDTAVASNAGLPPITWMTVALWWIFPVYVHYLTVLKRSLTTHFSSTPMIHCSRSGDAFMIWELLICA